MAAPILSAERVKELFVYDPETGNFFMRVRSGSRAAGAPIGRPHIKGYVDITFACRHYYAHRLAWLYMTGKWPDGQIDHINGIRNDNRWANLRDVTQSKNMLNQRRAHPTNMLGVLGVRKLANCNRYSAQFQFQGEKIVVGYFDDPKTAKNEYDKVKSFMTNSPHADALKSLVAAKDISPNGLRSIIDLLG